MKPVPDPRGGSSLPTAPPAGRSGMPTRMPRACHLYVPAAAYDQAARHFDAQELAHLIWQIVAINAWNRVAIASHSEAGHYEATA